MDDDFPDHDGPRDKFRRERDVSREEINGPPKRYRGDDDRERERERERDRRSRSPDAKRRRGSFDRYDAYDRPPPRRYRSRDRDDDYYYEGGGGGGGGRRGDRGGDRERVQNPRELKYLVTKRHFKDYMRQVTGVKDDPDWDRKYDLYKEDFRLQESLDFFHAHKDEEWFTEKYRDPEHTAHLERVAGHKRELLERFENQLNEGLFDDASFDAATGGETAAAAAAANGTSEKVNGEDKADEEMAEGDDAALNSPTTLAAPAPVSGKRLLCWESPETEADVAHKVFIRAVSANMSRKTLEEAIAQRCPDFPPLRIALSDPNPSKKFVRLGWIVFPPGTDTTVALTTLEGLKIGDTELSFAAHHLHPPRSRLVPEVFSKGERIRKDLEVAEAVARAFDEEVGVSGLSGVLERLEGLVGPRPVVAEGKAMDVEGAASGEGAEELEKTKKRLDMILTYLRRVHLFDYYSGMGTDSVEDFSRKFPPNLRSSTALESDRNAEDFSSKKAVEKVDLRGRYYGKLLSAEELAKLEWRDPEAASQSRMRSMMKEEGEFRYRCMQKDNEGKDCGKLFKGPEFVEKHLVLKHPEVPQLLEDAKKEAEYVNSYVRDPCRITMVREPEVARSNRNSYGGTPMGGAGGGRRDREPRINARLGPREEQEMASPVVMGRMDRRQLRDYTDLDAVGPPAGGEVDISYD